MEKLLNWLVRPRESARAFGHHAAMHAPREVKSGQGSLLALHGPVEASWISEQPESLVVEGYMRNPVVHRCVRLISEAAASMPWLLYEGREDVESHPLLDLLRNPVPGRTASQMLETLFGYLLLYGNAYMNVVTLDGLPRELHVLRPDRVRLVTDREGWPLHWELDGPAHGRIVSAEQPGSEILHLQQFNPLDDWNGLSPLKAARMALDTHNAASRWNKALLDNSARPSGALVYSASDGSNLTPDQFDRLKEELETGYTGSARAGRPLLLEGGLDWKAMGYSPKDMDFMEARNGAARDIALAFGVPPMLLGIPGDNTYSNYQEANRALWRHTILPLAAKTASAIGAWLGAWYDEAIRLEFDFDQVDALSADRDAAWSRLNGATFLTLNEKRAAAGYAPLQDGGEQLSDDPHE
ncbi:MAG: phage portal protein [Rhizobiaceae bacterium]